MARFPLSVIDFRICFLFLYLRVIFYFILSIYLFILLLLFFPFRYVLSL